MLSTIAASTQLRHYSSSNEPKQPTQLSHVDDAGKASMVDVSEKPTTHREATATAKVFMSQTAWNMARENLIKKGDVVSVAQLAGIMGAKRTSELIPLCHQLSLSKVHVKCNLESIQNNYFISVLCTARCVAQTGVEMEALTGATVAALTIYDMCKAVDKSMRIGEIQLIEKIGGKSGHFINNHG